MLRPVILCGLLGLAACQGPPTTHGNITCAYNDDVCEWQRGNQLRKISRPNLPPITFAQYKGEEPLPPEFGSGGGYGFTSSPAGSGLTSSRGSLCNGICGWNQYLAERSIERAANINLAPGWLDGVYHN